MSRSEPAKRPLPKGRAPEAPPPRPAPQGPAPVPALAPAPAPRPPSLGQRKAYIVENAGILNRETKMAILSVVMLEVGPGVVREVGGPASGREVNIDLDAIPPESEDVITHIYNIVATRREALSQPVGAQAQQRGGGAT